jgi:hypothetical protein
LLDRGLRLPGLHLQIGEHGLAALFRGGDHQQLLNRA